MKKISDIISTPIISLYEGEYLGIISNILFDCTQNKCKYACILNENENIPQIIKFSDIYKLGKNCAFIKNKSIINLLTNCENELQNNINPINLKIYDLDGNFIGTSTDIIINDKNQIEKIIVNNNIEITTEKIFNIGKNTIITRSKEKIILQNFKPKNKINKRNITDNKVMILSPILTKEQSKAIDNSNQNNKLITDFRFLIGRILNKDIFALNGEIIAKKDSVITKDIVNKASSYGKLVEVARYSKS